MAKSTLNSGTSNISLSKLIDQPILPFEKSEIEHSLTPQTIAQQQFPNIASPTSVDFAFSPTSTAPSNYNLETDLPLAVDLFDDCPTFISKSVQLNFVFQSQTPRYFGTPSSMSSLTAFNQFGAINPCYRQLRSIGKRRVFDAHWTTNTTHA